MRRHVATALLIAATALLGGCEMLGIESAQLLSERKEAEGKAVGGACRHAGRAIEDCYAINRKADKAAVFAGWREMNDYMRENKIDAVAPLLVPDAQLAAKPADDAAADDDKSHGKPAGKATKPGKHDS